MRQDSQSLVSLPGILANDIQHLLFSRQQRRDCQGLLLGELRRFDARRHAPLQARQQRQDNRTEPPEATAADAPIEGEP
ncbi:hypothetical protein DWF00_18625 [Bosea caraganae]|uniref:Uncharacterized protein n=1 Tax=Bosea caraganae TaxID=2763117 RepID=A0A370L822_9HYPH|nr:hypothetical protein DWF00_18625 [Bosea caraganae]RDJ26311.1 hypothetical protein DWE98_10845 [Bosea caraganae]